MTPEQRHRCMSHIKGKGTKPELKVRKWLWDHGYRYRLNVKSVPGKPDIVMRPYRTAIFVNGCFWHGHRIKIENPKFEIENYPGAGLEGIKNSECCKIPHTNREFWVGKILRNRERDERNYRLLQENGWQVIVVWECQLKSDRLEHTMREVEVLLNENRLAMFRRPSPVPYDVEEDGNLLRAAEDPSDSKRNNR